jgi:hypothetical protein
MIPTIKYNLIANLIESKSELFKNSAMIGIYDGQDICSCFLNKAKFLNTLSFYENFQDSQQQVEKERLLVLYESWKQKIPNLTIDIGDGTSNLNSNSLDFLFTDAYNIDYKTYFLNKQFKKTCMAICGFGAELTRTVDISVCINNKELYPVLLYKGFLFFANNQDKYNELCLQIKQFLDLHNIDYTNRRGCLRPNGWYHSLLNNGKDIKW